MAVFEWSSGLSHLLLLGGVRQSYVTEADQSQYQYDNPRRNLRYPVETFVIVELHHGQSLTVLCSASIVSLLRRLKYSCMA